MDKQQLITTLRAHIQRVSMEREFATSESLRAYAFDFLASYLARTNEHQSALDAEQLVNEVIEACMGFGALSRLLANDAISEIMVNDFATVFIERDGHLEKADTQFANEAELMQIIERMVLPLGRRIDSAQPMVDARLPDGSRMNAVIAPLALRGACLTIRKFSRRALTFADLEQANAISEQASCYLERIIARRKNIMIVGGTGTGKTTFLNLLASKIPSDQRLITIEDAAELKLNHANLVSLEARPANAEGSGQVSIRDLLINALRMRPDRIIVGECRGAEALDMLQAMNTGHEGSLTTLHANSPREGLQRLEVMVMLAGFEIPLLAIRQQIASAIQVIVQVSRSSQGQRVVTAISEVVGLEASTYQVSPLFQREHDRLVATGVCSEWDSDHAY